MMRIIKLGLISCVAFAFLITGISLFFPSQIRISKAIDIQAEGKNILEQLSNPGHWRNWYPGADSMQVITAGGTRGIGNAHSLGQVSVTGISDNSVTTKTILPGGRQATGGWNVLESGLPNTFTVQWYMDIRLRWYPWEKFSGLLLEKRYGPSMEKGLERLKSVLQ